MTGPVGTRVNFVVPEGIDDPALASGGNVFDRHVRDGLAALGWDVRMLPVGADAGGVLSRVPPGALVLVDGLVAGRSPAAIEAEADRLRIVVLAHMVSSAFPDADPHMVDGERRALGSARRVIATSEWTRAELTASDRLPADRVLVALPGSDDAPAASGTPTGGSLLCVGVVAPHKGQDVLIEALAALDPDISWTCAIVGGLDAFPDYVERVRALAEDADVAERISLTGALGAGELDSAYQHADLVVAPSRVESYGMAIADALRRGIPVVASRVGGIPQTVAGRAAVLVPPGEPAPLAEALQRWIADPRLRERLTEDARRGRASLPRWSDTAASIAESLAGV